MKTGQLLVAALVTAAVSLAGAPVRATNASKLALAAQGGEEAVQSAGNGIYTVYVEDSGDVVGVYTATTGPLHPAGAGLNVLFGGGAPGTTFNSIRSYTTNTDYTQIPGRTSSNATVSLGPLGSVSPIGSTGYRTTYNIASPDMLTIFSDVNVNGTTFENSSISVTTTVQNNGPGSVQIGVRYLWDYQIGSDDGPTFQAIMPDGPVLVKEAEFTPPNFVQYRIVDNDVNPSPPTFFVFGTATGPSSLTPTPTTPGKLQYASWPGSFGTAFDYSVNPLQGVGAPSAGGNDSACIYYFGPSQESAITIPSGESASVTALLFLSASPEPPSGGGGKQAPALGAVGLTVVAFAMLLIGLATLRRRSRVR